VPRQITKELAVKIIAKLKEQRGSNGDIQSAFGANTPVWLRQKTLNVPVCPGLSPPMITPWSIKAWSSRLPKSIFPNLSK
jgi:hypothetical protein